MDRTPSCLKHFWSKDRSSTLLQHYSGLLAMPARVAAALGLAACLTQGARVDRKRKAAGSKFVAGVLVLNYHHAFEGQTFLAQTNNLGQASYSALCSALGANIGRRSGKPCAEPWGAKN